MKVATSHAEDDYFFFFFFCVYQHKRTDLKQSRYFWQNNNQITIQKQRMFTSIVDWQSPTIRHRSQPPKFQHIERIRLDIRGSSSNTSNAETGDCMRNLQGVLLRNEPTRICKLC